MKILFYFLTFICGFIGLLSLFRSIELLTLGGSVKVVQIVIAVIALALGWLFFNKSRGK